MQYFRPRSVLLVSLAASSRREKKMRAKSKNTKYPEYEVYNQEEMDFFHEKSTFVSLIIGPDS